MKIVKYGLRSKDTKTLYQVSFQSNDGDDNCNSTRVELCPANSEGVWLADSIEQVKKALNQETKWYNSSYENPMIDSYYLVPSRYPEIIEIILELPDGTTM